MPLPSLGDSIIQHVIEFPNVTATFQLRIIPGAVYNAIIEHHKALNEGQSPQVETVGPMLLTHGVRAHYDSEVSTPQPWELPDRGPEEPAEAFVARVPVHEYAAELWTTWPEFARVGLYNAVVAYSTRGEGADPFSGAKRRGSGDG